MNVTDSNFKPALKNFCFFRDLYRPISSEMKIHVTIKKIDGKKYLLKGV
jgi:hypothetical protein